MQSSSVRDSPAFTRCTSSARRGWRSGCTRRRRRSAGPGTTTDTRVRAATWRASTTATRSPTSCSRSGAGRRSTPTQAEILRYMNWVADKLDLRSGITFNTRVISAVLDEEHAALDGDDRRRRGRHCPVLHHGNRAAVGGVDTGLPRLEQLAGEVYHTAHWPHQPVDFTGKRVAVIGTGSSGIQSVPVIAEQAVAAPRVPAHAELQCARGQSTTDRRGRRRVQSEL